MIYTIVAPAKLGKESQKQTNFVNIEPKIKTKNKTIKS
jgi:hypothetical protein